MVVSEQKKDLGDKWFAQLQDEVKAANPEALEEFRAAIDPDAMGAVGEEGIDAN